MGTRSGQEKNSRQSRGVGVQIGLKSWLCFICLLAAVTASATGVIYSTHRSRHLLNELHQLEGERNTLQVEWGQLLLEQSSLVSQGRIENVAITELGMKIPDMENVVVVSSE